MPKTPYLSVIIPAYNESDNLKRKSLALVTNYLSSQKFTYEIVLVNDGSSDNTLKLLNDFTKHHKQTRIINNPHMGKAASIISGALAATGDIILFTDTDQSTPIAEFNKFIPLLKTHHIIIGSRSGRKGAPLFRQTLAYGMIMLRTLILRLPFKDTQCGFKAFSREAAQKIFKTMLKLNPPKVITVPTTNPGFDVELLYLGQKLGYAIAEVPVTWHYQESRRVSFVKDAISGITGLLLVRWRSLTNTYGLH